MTLKPNVAILATVKQTNTHNTVEIHMKNSKALVLGSVAATTVAVAADAAAVTFRNDTRRLRAYTLFTTGLPNRAALGNTAFRASIINALREEFKMTLASAAATYNVVKKLAVEQKLTEDFGRTPAAPKEPKAAKAPKEPKAAKPSAKAVAAAEAATEGTVKVVRAKDGQEVAAGITLAEAQKMVDAAVKQKKAKLEIEVA